MYDDLVKQLRYCSMTDEELAKLFTEIQSDATNIYAIFPEFPDEEESWNMWLKQEASDEK